MIQGSGSLINPITIPLQSSRIIMRKANVELLILDMIAINQANKFRGLDSYYATSSFAKKVCHRHSLHDFS